MGCSPNVCVGSFPSDEQFAWLIVIVQHADQMVPKYAGGSGSGADKWQGTGQFNSDHQYILNKLGEFVERWANDKDGRMDVLKMVENTFAKLVRELQASAKSANGDESAKSFLQRAEAFQIRCSCVPTDTSHLHLE